MVKASGNRIMIGAYGFSFGRWGRFWNAQESPQSVIKNEFFGCDIYHHMMETLLRLSLSCKLARANYTFTLESQ
jgi:hypothetical protein